MGASDGRGLLRVASVNVNGIRAAVNTRDGRPGLREWLAASRPDVVTLQETRAPAAVVAALLGDSWRVVVSESPRAGRAGVAVAVRPGDTVRGIDTIEAPVGLETGRWVEATVDLAPSTGLVGPFVVASAYVHTGDADDETRMAEKLAFLDAVDERVAWHTRQGHHVLVTGDFNVAHRDVDLKNWKGNRNKAGVLAVERERLDRLAAEHGMVDLGRRFGGDGPGPYTWWSYRGRAFDNDAGWRIDYQLASPTLAERAVACDVHRADDYHLRWSDHAPVVVDFRG